MKYIDPDGNDVFKPSDSRIVYAIRKAYRTSSTFRNSYNKVLNNSKQRWTFQGGHNFNAKAFTTSEFPKFGQYNVGTNTVVNLDEKGVFPATQEVVKTLANEATHANEQSTMQSKEEMKAFYDTETGNGKKVSGGVCTEDAMNNEQISGEEYYDNTEEDQQYMNLFDDEFDNQIFTKKEKK